MGIEPRGTAEQMRVRIKEEVDRLKAPVDGARGVVGQLPRVVALKREIERLVALPVPGYWELQECVEVLGVKAEVPSEEAVYESYRTGELDEAIALMGKRNDAIYAVLCEVRSRVQEFGLLVNDARPLDAAFMDLCKEEHMRKLFYMQQFEVLAKLTELWQTRIDGCPDAPILEYRAYTPGASPTERTTHTFALVSGTLDVPADKDRAVSFFDYLLVEDTDADDDVPLEALFDDLPVMGLMFPLNRWTRARWDAQHDRVRAGALLADVRDVGIDAAGRSTAVAVHTWGEMRLGKGKRYRLSPRLVDFNLAKVLATLLELDMRCESEGDDEEEEGEDVPFLQLISDPRALSGGEGEKERAFLRAEVAMQSMFRQLHELGSEPAGRLLLKQSQRHATRRILSSRLAVVWGPPGTGKTHTITASLLRLLECEASMNTEPQIIFLTAMTHAAIEACLSKLESLMACYRAIPSLPTRWLDKVKVEHVLKGGDHPLPARGTPNSHIYAGTVYQLYNFSKRRVLDVDCVVIDEAGQLSLGAAALALRSLAPNGRIVIAGDSEQLAPIFTAQYPRLETRLFGSILDCVMHLATGARERDDDVESVAATDLSSEVVSSQVSTVVQLTENFRLNPDLGDFVSTIYSRAFKPQKVQVRHLATRLGALDEGPASDGIAESARSFLVALSRAMLRDDQELLRPPLMASIRQGRLQASDPLSAPLPISLALIRLKAQTRFPTQIGYETHVRGEAAVAASLVRCLQTVSPEDEVFVATPHRIQRHAVKEALNAMPPMASTDDDLTDAMGSLNVVGGAMSKVTIDTVERLQGSEAAFVICLFSDTSSRSASLDFLLERRRLNVAISRAKTLCILVTSDEVLRPAVGVLANEEAAKGYAFLRAFEERAWSGTINVDLDDL